MNIAGNGMKSVVATAVFLLAAAGLSARGLKTDADGHVLVREWKEYSEAVRKDLPQSGAEVLEEIMDKAEDRRLTWDFYDAIRKYYGTVASYDWKKAGAAVETLKERITGYGSPVMIWNFADVWPFYTDREDIGSIAAMKELQREKNSRFYSADRFIGNGRVPDEIVGNIGNDYEYLLWSALMYGYGRKPGGAGKDSADVFTAAADVLESHLGGRYPESAYLEFIRAMRIPDGTSGMKKSALKDFIARYHDRSVRLFAEQELIRMEFDSLTVSGNAVSGDYSALREKCVGFDKARKAEKGSEAELVKDCTYPAELARQLDYRRLKAEIVANTDTLRMILQNIGEVEVRILSEDSTEVLVQTSENREKSYYVPDTLCLVLPEMDDGRYRVTCREGDVAVSFNYDRHTLSMAWQEQEGGYAVYLADFMTGKPVEKADVSIFCRDSLVRTIPDMDFDGFTLLDMDFPEDAGYYVIQCSHVDADGICRKTEKEYIRMYRPAATYTTDSLSAAIFKNMAAFHPGDTLRFKAVLFERFRERASGCQDTGWRVWRGSEPVIAELIDPSREVVASDTLAVNDFGSVSGWFRLPEDRLNGWFTLSIRSAGRILASDAVTVDEFVLPTFTVTFSPTDEILLPGDSVEVKGRLESYAGVSLAAARVTYSVGLWNEMIDSGELAVGSDGGFSISFKAGEHEDGRTYSYYNISVKVTDATGETHEFHEWVAVQDFSMGVRLENDAEAFMARPDGWEMDAEADSADFYSAKAVDGDFAVLSFYLKNAGYEDVPGEKVTYSVYSHGDMVYSGEALTGEKVWVDLSSWPSGLFRVKAVAEARGRQKTCVCDLVKTSETDTSLDGTFLGFVRILDSDDIRLQFGASSGPVWAVIQLFGNRNACLMSDILHLEGGRNQDGSLELLSYEYKDEYPDITLMKIIWFRDGNAYSYEHEFRRNASDLMLPLAFSSFTDKSRPGVECRYEIRTLPGVECAVSVFDATVDAVRTNIWSRFEPYSGIPVVYGSYSAGSKRGGGRSPGAGKYPYSGESEAIPFQLAGAVPRLSVSSTAENASDAADMGIRNALMTKSSSGAGASVQTVSVRDDFSETLAFYPFLRSDEEGRIPFGFMAGDKLSTYYVSVFAHDKSMKNNVLLREMMIALPVTVSVSEPAYLYSGDRYDMQVSLSNTSDTDSEGMLTLYIYDSQEYRKSSPVMVKSRPVKVAAGSAVSALFSVNVPADVDTLGLKVIYQAAAESSENGEKTVPGASDGLFVTVPVSAPEQTLYESHSAILQPGMSRDSLYQALLGEFVNVSGYGAASEEISIADMLRESVPEHVSPESPDALSAASAYLAAVLSSRLEDRGENDGHAVPDCGKLRDLMLSYQNAGGGFSWLKGGQSSPLITAVVLEYISMGCKEGLPDQEPVLRSAAEHAVAYLDKTYFNDENSWSGLTLPQYLFIRSLYPDIPIAADLDRKTLKDFSKAVRKYLRDRKAGAPGYILYKARRAMTLLDFVSASGNAFLESAKVRVNAGLSAGLDRQMASLKEYAVAHRSGGMYFPNAVMPFRGLLENELYAHSVLCRLMSCYAVHAGDEEAARIADGIRLWIMVQKETQDWDDDPAYLLALDAVMEGPAEILDTRILALTQKYRKPFSEIKAAGNDISVKCRYLIQTDSVRCEDSGYPGYREIREGEVLSVGDEVLAVYEIWSAENRSYVCLTAPRPASMRPEKQLSGMYGVTVRPRAGSVASRIAYPYAYREVKAGSSRWFVEVLPEENTVLTEKLTVTQSGVFSSRVADIVCLYAPHYRANDGYCPPVCSEK